MVMYQRATITSTDDLIACAQQAGSPFFSRDTLRFFDSRTLSPIWAIDGYATEPGRRYLFVTSERYDATPRRYTVRIATLTTKEDNLGLTRPSIEIDTIGEFQQYETARQAKRAAQQIKEDMDNPNVIVADM